MKLFSILGNLISVSVLITGCSHQLDPERDRRAARAAFDDKDSDSIPPSAVSRPQVPVEDTYCDTEYLRTHPNADCDDYGRDRTQTMGGR